jgi:DNA-binding NarL/FixJ family response regulator
VSALVSRQRPIRVAVRVADRGLRERITQALREAGDFQASQRGDADVTVTDHAADVAGPVIALAPAEEAAAWQGDVRAALPADVDPALLGAAIVAAAAGLALIPARAMTDQLATGRWAEGFDPHGSEEDAVGEQTVVLTAREREVLVLLAAGASNKAIARALGVSVHTVKFHVASLAEKLGASGRLEAVAIALRTGLIMV